MAAYYNEIDPFAAQWLRNLITAGHIAPGDVDERSIEDVTPDDLQNYMQCHFFAGIGVWSYSLRRAGWPDEKPVWTGSCPCQPFSAAGKKSGFDDKRHLWPTWFRLISQCCPGIVFGEQVASKDGLAWLDLVRLNMETAEYAFAAVDLCAAGVGAPHIRQRLFWVADGERQQHKKCVSGLGKSNATESGWPSIEPTGLCLSGRVADANNQRSQGEWPYSDSAGWQGSDFWTAGLCNGARDSASAYPTNGFWRDADWLFCRDGKWRTVEPGTFPLAHGITNRVGRLRAYGNAINAEVATTFISAYMECGDNV
ncbi:DNA cytosine methyltransferase [Symbiopectobacterium purcellii]|uniref:DNA cytosine methyltransferase n=1 Tax=Symbiopectobacterium purcellii TaxID=2871826 RepID=UPI003F85A860